MMDMKRTNSQDKTFFTGLADRCSEAFGTYSFRSAASVDVICISFYTCFSEIYSQNLAMSPRISLFKMKMTLLVKESSCSWHITCNPNMGHGAHPS